MSRAIGITRRPGTATVLTMLGLFLVAAAIVSSTIGASGIPLNRLLEALRFSSSDDPVIARDQLILWSIRLPRIAMAIVVGGLLAIAGAIMQGLFRNPLADPALVGVSGGAALAAAVTIVVSDKFVTAHISTVPFEVLPVAALAGALVATLVLYRIATQSGRTSIAIFLLGGLAIAAITNAGLGLLVFVADDRQLRDITFWTLGSLSGATWLKVWAVLPFYVVVVAAIPFISRGLDLLILGEAEAFHMGVSVERLKKSCVVLLAAAVGAAVAASGVIGFVGIVVPHLLRLAIGPSHRLLLPATVLLGGILLVCADTVARILASPAEVPIGIVTAVIGAPFFLALLLRQRTLVGL